MLNRDEALKICETVLAHAKAAGAEDASVSLQSTGQSHARFADNRITTSGRADDLDITATVWVGRGAARHRQRSERGRAEALADEAVQIARVSPVHREYVPTLGPLTYPEPRLRGGDGRRRSRRAREDARQRCSRPADGEGHRRRLPHRRAQRPRPPRPPTATAATSARARPASASRRAARTAPARATTPAITSISRSSTRSTSSIRP